MFIVPPPPSYLFRGDAMYGADGMFACRAYRGDQEMGWHELVGADGEAAGGASVVGGEDV